MNPLHAAASAGSTHHFLGSLLVPGNLSLFWLALLAHLLLSVLAASLAYLLQPREYRSAPLATWLLFFSFAFMLPLFGALGVLLLVRSSLKQSQQRVGMATPVSVELPQYDVQTKEVNRSGQGAIRSRLDRGVPAAIRMQSLLTLQSVPNRVANPILEDLLGDSTDDVRLVAFGMLDAEEKKISSHIQTERDNLQRALTPEQRFNCHKHLAELHWELIYGSLAQGELRQHTLNVALQQVQHAEALGLAPNSGLTLLKGRILLALGQVDAAREALQHAQTLGQPLSSVLPYLAEIAFDRREFATVRQLMGQIDGMNIAAKTRAVADFWSGRDLAAPNHDRRFLPHV